MTIHIRPGIPADLALLVQLFQEMSDHFGEDVPAEVELQRRISEALFGERPAAEALLAFEGSHVVGFSIICQMFPGADATISAFIMELFVRRGSRGHGVGRALMRGIMAIAVDRSYSRVEWTTMGENARARKFYDEYSAIEAHRIYYRLDRVAMIKFLASDDESVLSLPNKPS